MRPSKGHSLSGDPREREKSEDRVNATEQGALTSWRSHQVGQLRTGEKSDRARGTHFLETPSGGTSQDTKEKVENHKISDTEVVANLVVLVVTLFQ